jgi:hypothetical protein
MSTYFKISPSIKNTSIFPYRLGHENAFQKIFSLVHLAQLPDLIEM